VIFSDISQDLLDICRGFAQDTGNLDRCRFLKAHAEDLAVFQSASVNVVTTRSVLIYVKAKEAAFKGFFRVLKPGGRLSIFEPINRFGQGFIGFDIAPVKELCDKIYAIYRRLQPLESDPMLDFDERDLFSLVEKAGFAEIHLELQADIIPEPPIKWETVLRMSGNPRIPSLGEAMQQVLTDAEIEQFTRHMRPQYEGGLISRKWAVAYLWAIKK
jgi:arsenite methyltransferase